MVGTSIWGSFCVTFMKCTITHCRQSKSLYLWASIQKILHSRKSFRNKTDTKSQIWMLKHVMNLQLKTVLDIVLCIVSVWRWAQWPQLWTLAWIMESELYFCLRFAAAQLSRPAWKMQLKKRPGKFSQPSHLRDWKHPFSVIASPESKSKHPLEKKNTGIFSAWVGFEPPSLEVWNCVTS